MSTEKKSFLRKLKRQQGDGTGSDKKPRRELPSAFSDRHNLTQHRDTLRIAQSMDESRTARTPPDKVPRHMRPESVTGEITLPDGTTDRYSMVPKQGELDKQPRSITREITLPDGIKAAYWLDAITHEQVTDIKSPEGFTRIRVTPEGTVGVIQTPNEGELQPGVRDLQHSPSSDSSLKITNHYPGDKEAYIHDGNGQRGREILMPSNHRTE